jgi:hypothetical protein
VTQISVDIEDPTAWAAHLAQLELDKKRLDVLEEINKDGGLFIGARRGGSLQGAVTTTVIGSVYATWPTLREAADAEIARTTRTPEHE